MPYKILIANGLDHNGATHILNNIDFEQIDIYEYIEDWVRYPALNSDGNLAN